MIIRLWKTLAILFGVTLIHGAPPAALALDPPGGAEISSTLAAELPAWWSVRSVDVTASVNEGDDVTPRYRQRFVADAFPKEDLYLPVSDDGRIGPFTMLITTHAATRVRKLYGVATSVIALGEWSIKLGLENSVAGVGRPRSSYEGPVAVAGAEQTDEVAQEYLRLHELSKTVTEGLVRSRVSAEALDKLAADERTALEEANRRRLAALKEKYREELVTFTASVEGERQRIEAANKVRLTSLMAGLQEEIASLERKKAAVNRERKHLVENSQRMLDDLARQFREERAAFAAAAARERQRVTADNRKRLVALKAEIGKENAKLDEHFAALDQTRKLTVQENRRKLHELQAQYQRKRAQLTAVSETLGAITRVEAETEAQKKLAAARAILAKETKRAADAAQQARAMAQQARDIERKEKQERYNALMTALGSKNLAERNAGFDTAIESDDEHLKKIAIDRAMKSGDDGLQAKALAALIVKSPQIGVELINKEKKKPVVCS